MMFREQIKWLFFPGLNLNARLRFRVLPKFFGRPKPGEQRLVLDAGCGNGMLSYQAYRMGNKVLGVSIKDEVVRDKKFFNEYHGIADDRLGNRIGRCIVRRDDRTDAGHDVPAVDGHLSFPEQRPRIRPPLPTGGLDPLPEGGGLMEDIERIDPLRDHLAAVGHQIARHGTAARRRATRRGNP